MSRVCHYPKFIGKSFHLFIGRIYNLTILYALGTYSCCVHLDENHNYINHVPFEHCPHALSRLKNMSASASAPYSDKAMKVINEILADIISNPPMPEWLYKETGDIEDELQFSMSPESPLGFEHEHEHEHSSIEMGEAKANNIGNNSQDL